MNALLTKLEEALPREESGSQTAARYDFQANYSLLKIIELRETGSDFRIVFDLYDDLLILDSSTSPTEARLYQLKSKDPGHWTCAGVCEKVGAKAPRSIVSRLYSHIELLGDFVAETNMVSNAAYKMVLRDGTETSGTHLKICGNELSAAECAKIDKAVREDIAKADTSKWLPKLVFVRTSLGVADQDDAVIGKLQKHLEHMDQLGDGRIAALYSTLHAAVIRKTTFTGKGIEQKQLYEKKSLTRGDIDSVIERASQRKRSVLENWDLIKSDLDAVGMGTLVQSQIRTAAIQFQAERRAGSEPAVRFDKQTEEWAAANGEELGKCKTLLELAQKIQKSRSESYGFTQIALLAACLVRANEVSSV